MDMNLIFVIVAGVLALLYAFWKSTWVAKQDPGNEYSNHFLGLDLDMDHLAAKKLANNYQYSFKTEEELTVTDMKLQKFGIFEVDSLPFVIQTKPYYADEV